MKRLGNPNLLLYSTLFALMTTGLCLPYVMTGPRRDVLVLGFLLANIILWQICLAWHAETMLKPLRVVVRERAALVLAGGCLVWCLFHLLLLDGWLKLLRPDFGPADRHEALILLPWIALFQDSLFFIATPAAFATRLFRSPHAVLVLPVLFVMVSTVVVLASTGGGGLALLLPLNAVKALLLAAMLRVAGFAGLAVAAGLLQARFLL